MATPGTAAAGQLPSAKGTLYTADDDLQARVSLCNVSGGTLTATLYVKPSGGSSIKVIAQPLAPGENFIWPPASRWDLATGDVIEGMDGAGTSIDFLVSKLTVT